jgi:serine protease Do
MSTSSRRIVAYVAACLASAVLGSGITAGTLVMVYGPAMQNLPGQVTPSGTPAPTQPVQEVVTKIEPGSNAVVPIATKVMPSIVGIRVTDGTSGPFASTSEGSGVIVWEDGYILTNNHVIEGIFDTNGQLITGATIDVFAENYTDPFPATVVGRDVRTDLALLKIEAAGLTPAEFGNSDLIRVGELAVAIGNPGGLQFMGSVTSGIISGLNREIVFEDGTTMRLIQTDAAVNPGNSGGALLNAAGMVIGINSSGLNKTTYEGVNFAIPSNLALTIATDLKEHKYVTGRPWLGISVLSDAQFSVARADKGWPDGIYVYEVMADGPSFTAGLSKDDIITEMNGKPLTTQTELKDALALLVPGDTAALTVYRTSTGEYHDISVTLQEKKN